MISLDIPSIVPHVNVLILLMEVPQLLLQPLLLQPLQLKPQQVDVDLLNGQMINGVMMKTITQNALGMVVRVVVMTSIPSIVLHVNVLILLMEVPQLLLQLQPQLLHNLHQQMHVDLHNGQMINGATMKTTMKDVTLMVALVASTMLLDGIT